MTPENWAWNQFGRWWLEAEGGYVDNPNDPGGATRYGIASRFHPKVDLATLTPEGALQILRDDYWTPNRCEEVAELAPLTAWSLCDFAGNANALAARKQLQSAVGTKDDGAIGPKTLGAIAALAARHGDRWLAWRLCRKRAARQCRISTTPAAFANLPGLINRISDLEYALLTSEVPELDNG